MKLNACEKYQTGRQRGEHQIGEELARHLSACPSCAEAYKVASWLQRAASEPPPSAGRPRPLPSAGQLWWKAQIIRRLVANESAAERATRPVRWTQWAGLGLLGLLVPLLLAWLLGSLVGALGLPLSPEVLLGASGQRWLLALLAIGFGLPVVGFAVLWMLWREA